MVAVANITFNLNILFRFFLVLHADGFVKRGQLNLKLFRQLYWLAWTTFVTIEVIVFAGAPIFKGDIFHSNSRGRICTMLSNHGEVFLGDEEDIVKTSYTKFGLIVQLVYTIRFVKRVRRYVKGHCPRNKMSSIGKYRRNVVNMHWEFGCSVLGSCFPSIDYALRKISMTYIPQFAFLVNFVLIDSMVYLFYIFLFFALRRNDIPTKRELPAKCTFYISHPKHLEPRRSTPNTCSLVGQDDTNVGAYQFPNIPVVRKAVLPSEGRQYKMLNYVSTQKTDQIQQSRRNSLWLNAMKSRQAELLYVRPLNSIGFDENHSVSSCGKSNPQNICSPPRHNLLFNRRFIYIKKVRTKK